MSRWRRGRQLLAAAFLCGAIACGTRSSPPSALPAPPSSPAPPARDTITLSIVATTDLHGHLEALPWLSGHVAIIRGDRARDGGAVLLVDSGDMFQGSLESNLTEGASIVRGYNALGYAAAAIGNHEFDFGPVGPSSVPRAAGDDPRGALKARAREARFPLLTANLTSDDPRWIGPDVRPSVLIEAAGLKIGVIGVTSSRTREATDSRNLVGVAVTPVAATLAAEARRLRVAGADLVVGLAHAGGVCRAFDGPDDLSGCDLGREIFAVARDIPVGLVDVIAAGHTHQAVAHRVNGIAIVQAFAEGRAFARVDVVVETKSRKVQTTRIFPPRFVCSGLIAEDGAPAPTSAIVSFDDAACSPAPYDGQPVRFDAALREVLQADVTRAQAVRHRALGVTLASPFPIATRTESPAGNLVVDLMRAARPQAQVAVYNSGGLRATLPAGPLTYGRLHELLPFDSTVALTDTTAGALGRALARSLTVGFMPALSGVRGNARCEGGRLRVAITGAHGGELTPDSRLTVVTTDFLASGGDGIFTDPETPFQLEPGPPLRDVVAEVLMTQPGPLRPDDSARFDAARPRIVVPGPLPLRCDR